MKTGIVVKTTGSWHTVKDGHLLLNCRLKGNFRTRNLKNTNPLAVGDKVNYEISDTITGVITHIHDRKNYIIRKSTNLSKENQILASNIDQVLLMFTLDYPETPLEFVDRFLVSAEAYRIPCILIINKIDLYHPEKLQFLEEVRNIYVNAGYPLIDISVISGIRMDAVFNILQNKLSLIAGNSGIGKSSLINYFCPAVHLKTNDISWYHNPVNTPQPIPR